MDKVSDTQIVTIIIWNHMEVFFL